MAEKSTQNMLATGYMMGAASVVRAGVGCLQMWSERVPSLIALGDQMRDPKAADGAVQGQFRDELIAIARDASEIALRELRRGVEDLDTFTRPDEPPSEKHRRPYKTKP